MTAKRSTPLLDAAKKREIVAILTVGCTKTVAARYVGCCVSTIRRAAIRDAKFAARLRKAEASLEFTYLKHIDAAASDARHWRAAAWALERRFPQRYGQRKSRTATPEQVARVLAQFAEIVAQEVADLAERKKIQQRVRALAKRLKADSK